MPSFGNRSLHKYEDKYFTQGIGKISFSAMYHDLYALARVSAANIQETVKSSTDALVARIRARAPRRTGDLREGIIRSPKMERSSNPDKIVYDIYMDAKMNATFVKMSKAGKRYYYPSSQEYGFRIGRAKRKPGLYYMRDTAVEYYAEHILAVSAGVDKILEEL